MTLEDTAVPVVDADEADEDVYVEPPDVGADPGIVLPPPPIDDGIYGFASGCYAVEGFDGVSAPRYLAAAASGDTFAFSEDAVEAAARFRMRASDLGTYLFYDGEKTYFSAMDEGAGWQLARSVTLESDIQLLDDTFKSPAEWHLEVSDRDPQRYQLEHYRTGAYLTLSGLTEDASSAAIITLYPREGCPDFPELPLDASGSVSPKKWDDGDVWGVAEIHSHMFSNAGFGGGGIFHGAPFHRLGVEHALSDCEPFHGPEGRRDLVGVVYDGEGSLDVASLLPMVLAGQAEEFNHFTAGYPDFTHWPNARHRSTHQTMYYRWVERAYLAGLRLLVQHATGNSVLCELMVGLGVQKTRYSCNDMVSVDRAIQDVRSLERYIDAQSGGPGKGWFRIVESPQAAREVINQGKLAVVLGIEISNVFDCFLTPREGFPTCTPEIVAEKLDHYRDLGVRAIFPVHKYDNAFSAGDGSGGIIELGNFINSGNYSNFVEDCPGPSAAFDGGNVSFGGLNKPRDAYDSPPPVDMSGFVDDVLATLLPFLEPFTEPPLVGNYCQKHGMTPLGETLMGGLMLRGMLIDISHFPQRALGTAYELLEAAKYPATKTHGNTNKGRIYEIGGLAGGRLGRCGDPDTPGTMISGYTSQVAEAVEKGAYPSEALSFDLNGFAGGPGPRFGPDSGCGQPQANPITYPFESFDGEVTFQQPYLGTRQVDFNEEGMIHIGLLPELIEDVRRDGATDQDLEPLFRSAEAYLRLWEQAEANAGL